MKSNEINSKQNKTKQNNNNNNNNNNRTGQSMPTNYPLSSFQKHSGHLEADHTCIPLYIRNKRTSPRRGIKKEEISITYSARSHLWQRHPVPYWPFLPSRLCWPGTKFPLLLQHVSYLV